MKQSKLYDFLNDKINSTEFKKYIFEEVFIYRQKLAKKGASADILLIQDIELFRFGKNNLTKLLNLFNKGELEEYELSYIADCLILAENVVFENREIENSLEFYTLPTG